MFVGSPAAPVGWEWVVSNGCDGFRIRPPPPLWGGSGLCRMAATVSVYAPRPPCGVGVVLNGCDMVAIILIYAPPVEWECCPLAAMFCVGMLVECCRM